MALIEWQLAIRFLREGKTQTALITSGIALGIAVIIFISALVTGLQANIIERTLGTQAHIVLSAPDRTLLSGVDAPLIFRQEQARPQKIEPILNWPLILNDLKQHSELKAISPFTSGAAFALRGQAEKAVALIGIDPDAYRQIIPLENYIKAGQIQLASDEAMVGERLATDLGLKVGDKLTLVTASNRSLIVRITAIFALGVKDPDQRWVYLSLRSAQNLLNLTGQVTGIDLQVKTLFAAENIAQQLQRQYGIRADSWMASNQQLMTALKSQTASTTIIRFFVLISVAFGIASVLAIAVVQKQKEIGILRAMGLSQHAVLISFLIQGGLLGLLGAIIGTVAGIGLGQLFSLFARSPSGEPLFNLALTNELIASSMLVATVTGLLAAAVPAYRAAKLDPVQAIRYG
ncbi:ABC transporter permease [Agitococcus lubricus]|uniref:Lipoprotein-releasing system permease protein n=1 Tax=Agitococcus lubricus TaxID=1077255 RepID=A0A2T5IWW4_9GAMM|nr:FtsX-like permease family protein [Agitococcus lubricus]PTQ88424.1 lipoprotein-releasing system permease protein [Agitococcus lubricus]